MVQMYKSNGPITLAQINALEARFSFSLPTAYREFLLTYNGGSPEPCGFLYQNQGKSYRAIANRFLGIQDGSYSLYEDLLTYKEREKRVPDNLIPIADDPGGNLICLSVSGSDCGKVYFWDHDLESDYGEEPDYSNVYFIANSFEEFFQNLTEFD
jgi:hypothetical protein